MLAEASVPPQNPVRPPFPRLAFHARAPAQVVLPKAFAAHGEASRDNAVGRPGRVQSAAHGGANPPQLCHPRSTLHPSAHSPPNAAETDAHARVIHVQPAATRGAWLADSGAGASSGHVKTPDLKLPRDGSPEPRPASHRVAAPSVDAFQRALMSLPSHSTQHIAAYPAATERSRHGADAWFDPLTSYPYFPLRRSQLASAAEDATQEAPAQPEKQGLYPHGFVPSTAQGERPELVVSPEDDAKQKSMAACMPLDLFDSPELDLVAPAALLATAAAEGRELHALSRHFDTHVSTSRLSLPAVPLSTTRLMRHRWTHVRCRATLRGRPAAS